MRIGSQLDAREARTRAHFAEVRGLDAVPQREAEIHALASKPWRGRQLYALRCDGPYGGGPHVQFVPRYLLWGLIDLGHFVCPFHR